MTTGRLAAAAFQQVSDAAEVMKRDVSSDKDQQADHIPGVGDRRPEAVNSRSMSSSTRQNKARRNIYYIILRNNLQLL